MKDLHYSIEIVYPKDKSKLIDSYTEAVFTIIKDKISFYQIDEILFKLKDSNQHK